MIRFATLVVLLFASALLPGGASAEPPRAGLKQALGLISATGAVVVPQEWGGIWTAVDSTYDCTGAFDFVSGSTDTICPGTPIIDTGGIPMQFNCTGSADANTVDVTCTGSYEIVPDCVASFVQTMHGTRDGDTFFMVSNTEVTYSGGAFGCDLTPATCMQINSHGTRTAPTPIEYCQTPAVPTTWGKLKLRYR